MNESAALSGNSGSGTMYRRIPVRDSLKYTKWANRVFVLVKEVKHASKPYRSIHRVGVVCNDLI